MATTGFTPTSGSAGLLEQLDNLGKVEVIPSGFLTPGTPGLGWTPYRTLNPVEVLQTIQPISTEERRNLELLAAQAEHEEGETRLAVDAAVKAHGHNSAITRTIVQARGAVAKQDYQTAQTLANTVTGLMEMAPQWAELRAKLVYAFGESSHRQQLSVVQVTGNLRAALEGSAA